jgi:transposase
MEEAPRRSSTDGFPFSLGIDVGKSSLELALREGEEVLARTTVPNDPEGHNALVDWLEDRGAEPEKACVCMEASGDFEKDIAHRLYEEGYRVSVVNPRRIKGYASSQLQRTKTDSADAALIARFGHREDPRPWDPPSASQSRLQELTRARQALQKEKTRTQNRLDESEDEAVRRAHRGLLDEIERGNLDCQT